MNILLPDVGKLEKSFFLDYQVSCVQIRAEFERAY